MSPLPSTAAWKYWALWALGGAALLVGVWHVGLACWQFLQPEAIVWDTGLYWGMGHALLNGLTPYKDIFEIKPPGIFLLSAFSWRTLGNGELGNILGAVSLLAFPLAFGLAALRRARRLPETTVTVVLFAILAGLLWSIFQEQKGGPWQVEPFGALFALAYTWVLFLPPANRAWRLTWQTATLFGAIGFKEPFLFSCAAAALIHAETPREAARNFLLPAGLALLLGTVCLALLHLVGPYLDYYLPALSFRSYGFGPWWLRGFGVIKVLKAFGSVAPISVVSLPLLFGTAAWFRQTDGDGRPFLSTWTIGSLLVALYLALLSVGIAGDYQAHHFVFFAPFFAALTFIVIESAIPLWSHRWVQGLFAALIVSFSLTLFWIAPPVTPPFNRESLAQSQLAADRIDAILDACHDDRYLYLLHGERQELEVYGLTKHSPWNQLLFWQIDNAIQYGQIFLDQSFDRLSAAQVVVTPDEGFVASNEKFGSAMGIYLNSAFSFTAPACAAGLETPPGYRLLYRTDPKPYDVRLQFNDPRLQKK